jgi:sulfate adenylyltransferase subunit 2
MLGQERKVLHAIARAAETPRPIYTALPHVPGPAGHHESRTSRHASINACRAKSSTPLRMQAGGDEVCPLISGLSLYVLYVISPVSPLESEAIEIIREAVAGARKPVMLYSIGKDSSAMLHLARKAFHPAVPPFPLLHVDTTWKFRDMYAHRERMAKDAGMQLIVHTNQEGVAQGVNPFTHGSSYYTDVMKTVALRQALDAHGFDVVFGGARRDEEKSRAKERIFSIRSPGHRWDPRSQRPELWNVYNTRLREGETLRVFPLSNWTEHDIWQYIRSEQIPIVPLYLAKERPVVKRGAQWIMVDDERFPLERGEKPQMKRVRFRTLGCYPLSAAIESDAATLDAVIDETFRARSSEREGRLIDTDQPGSMEKKKQEGYF